MKNKNNKFAVSFRDFLFANLFVVMGLTIANAQLVSVKHVPFDDFFKNQNLETMNITVINNNQVVVTPSTATNNFINTTNNNSCGNFLSNLTYGNRGQEVMKLQQLLNAKENAKLPVTGYFGPLTHKALVNFQNKYGLLVSGITDPSTRIGLNSIACGNTLKVVNTKPKVNTSGKMYVKKANAPHVENTLNKAGTSSVNAIGAPKNINFGSNKNFSNDLNEIVKDLKLSTTTSSTTVATGTAKVMKKSSISNFFNNFWSNYKNNFKKVENK